MRRLQARFAHDQTGSTAGRASMDRETVEVYERSASAYAAARPLGDTRRPVAFAAAVPDGAPRLDLGCGPGTYLPLLGKPVVAADAAAAMLVETRQHAPDALRVQCDLEALPFRRRALAGVWASKAHQHIAAERLPMALAELHHVLDGGRPARSHRLRRNRSDDHRR